LIASLTATGNRRKKREVASCIIQHIAWKKNSFLECRITLVGWGGKKKRKLPGMIQVRRHLRGCKERKERKAGVREEKDDKNLQPTPKTIFYHSFPGGHGKQITECRKGEIEGNQGPPEGDRKQGGKKQGEFALTRQAPVGPPWLREKDTRLVRFQVLPVTSRKLDPQGKDATPN